MNHFEGLKIIMNDPMLCFRGEKQMFPSNYNNALRCHVTSNFLFVIYHILIGMSHKIVCIQIIDII